MLAILMAGTMQVFSAVQCDHNYNCRQCYLKRIECQIKLVKLHKSPDTCTNMYLDTAGPWIHVPRYSWSLDTCT